MLVTSLSVMEDLVRKNRSLRWDGWDVVHFYPSETAWMSQYGSYHKGRWYMNRKFVVSNQGWEIPDRYLRSKK
jgi:hypothetical protein